MGWQDCQSLTHTHTPTTTPFSPCQFILPTLSVLLFIHVQRPLFVFLHSWDSTFTMVVGFLLARRFVVCSFLTRRPLFIFPHAEGWESCSSSCTGRGSTRSHTGRRRVAYLWSFMFSTEWKLGTFFLCFVLTDYALGLLSSPCFVGCGVQLHFGANMHP